MEHRPVTADPATLPRPPTSSLELAAIVAHWRLILMTVLTCAALAATALLLRTPAYESKTQLLVETGTLTLFREDPVVVPAPVLPNLLETQVRLIASRGIALEVVDALDLAADPEFGPRTSLRDRLAALLRPADAPDATTRRDAAATRLLEQLRAGSLGLSNVVEIGVTARSPDRAATIANAVSAAYRSRLDSAAADRAEGASAWTRARLQGVGTHARVIAEATPPAAAIGPRATLILAAALGAGALAGAAAAILFDLAAPAARSPDELAAFLGTDCLAVLPAIAAPRTRVALDAPGSAYARSLRHLAAALAEVRHGRPAILGVAAISAGEGATTVAANLAHLVAAQGHQVMLVDGNATDPAITFANGLHGAPGLGEALLGTGHDEITVVSDPASGLDILPIGRTDPAGPAASAFELPAVGDLAARLRASYELVIVDFPPILAGADLRAASAVLDALLLVADSRPKPHRLLRQALALAGASRARLVGVVVTSTASTRANRAAALIARGNRAA